MTKEKEATPKFTGTIAYSKHPVAGVHLYGDNKDAPTLEEMMDAAERSEIQSARKDALVRKLRESEAGARKQGEQAPKRYTVDPETGKIDVDEEEGEYTQKDAMMVSASIKGKSGQFDAAIDLITAAKALVSDNQSNVSEKPKEFYVDPESGVIIKDSENGEYTLSEARTISQSLQKVQQPAGSKSFLEQFDEITNGLVTKRISSLFGGGNNSSQVKDPLDVFIENHEREEKLKQIYGGGGGSGAQGLAQSGMRGEILKLLLEDERERLKIGYEHTAQTERNKHLGVLATTVNDHLGDGIQALKAAAAEFKGGSGTDAATQKATQKATPDPPPGSPQAYQCAQCQAKFTVPSGVNVDQVGCPNCGATYTKEQLQALIS